MKLRSKVMRGGICQLWLLVATLVLDSAWGNEICKRGQSWWNRNRESCIPCTKCDTGLRLAVKYPCEIHRDTICQSLYDIKIWPFNTPRRRSRKDNETSGNPSDYEYYEYVDYDSEVTERNDDEVTWDMQTTSLTLAASGCVVFFIVVIVLSLYHAKQWKVLKRVLSSDVEDLTAKLKLMESGGAQTLQPVVSTDHHLYCNIHIGKETLLGRRAVGPPDREWSPTPMDIGNTRGIINTLPTVKYSLYTSFEERHVIAQGKHYGGKFVPKLDDSTSVRKGMGNVYTQEKHQS